MFPPKAETQLEVARTICMGCPTQVDCLNFALVSKEEFGVWGGITEGQRKKIHKSIVADGFGNFKVEWNSQLEDYLYSLSQFLVKTINEEKILSQTQT